MELYLKVRVACDGGMSSREAEKLDAFIAIIDRWLDEDRAGPLGET